MTKSQVEYAISVIEKSLDELREYSGEVPTLIAHPATLNDMKVALGLTSGWIGQGPPREWAFAIGGIVVMADENCQGGIIRIGGKRRPML